MINYVNRNQQNPLRIAAPDVRARRLDCRGQSGCLDTAARNNWPGMSCTGCNAYEPMTRDELRDDAAGIADMWREIERKETR